MADEMDKTEQAIVKLDYVRRKKAKERTLYPLWLSLELTLNRQNEPYCNADNVRKILGADQPFGKSVWYDGDTRQVMRSDRMWADTDDHDLLASLQSDYGIAKMGPDPVRQGVDIYARTKVRAPLTDWLSGVVWDQTIRLPTWLADAYGCPQTEYSAAVGKCWPISMVARAFKPGCQVDTMPVLEGAQGAKKSTSLEILGGPWYRAITQPFGSKEWLEAITGPVWLAEVADLSGFRGRDLDHLKAALTTRVDRFRRSYDRRALDYPRRCVFAGSTNRDDWQADDTGGRRFLPFVVRDVNLEFIRAQRDQLFAEAVYRFKSQESWWDLPVVETEREIEARRDVDVWEEPIAEHLGVKTEASVRDIMRYCLDIDIEKQDKRSQMRVASVLRSLGFKRQLTYVGTTRVRVWKKVVT